MEIWPLGLSIGVFAAAAVVIATAGVKLSKLADTLADRIGVGEALFGGIFLGGTTSISGIVTSVTAASGGHPNLAYSNAVGGIAAQTVFLAIADMFHPKVNLEHAAASMTNVMYGALLVTLLQLPILASFSPEFAVLGVHPVSILLIVAYLYGLRLVNATRTEPMWRPRKTRETKEDVPEEEHGPHKSTARLWTVFGLLALAVALCGWAIARAGSSIASHTGLSETLVGALLTGVTTSLPELVTTVAAVRQGALTLAVGGIIGGNAFDVLFLSFSDIAYREGSLYHAIESRQLFLVALSAVMTTVLLMGLLRREKRGFANIGFESLLLLTVYAGGLAVMFARG